MRRLAIRMTELLVAFAIVISGTFSALAQDGFTDDNNIREFLHDSFDGKKFGMVIGMVDEGGTRIFGAGGLDNDTAQVVNGDTIFEIGSITKTFTALLLEDMVERGEMKMDDPVAQYLPRSVKMPAYNGKKITLQDLATQSSGLPFNPSNLPKGDNPFADYTAEKLYEFLSGYSLASEPGIKFQYSNLGMGLLGHAVSVKAGMDYESLVLRRICIPLHMESTGITLSPELKARMARGHDSGGKPASNYDFKVLAGAGALRSTANDLLRYVSANLGLTQSSLTPLMKRTQLIRHTNSAVSGEGIVFGYTAMPWVDEEQSAQTGLDLLGHAGGTGGYSAFIGFEMKKRRGVVVLSNQQGAVRSGSVGWLLLEGVELTPQIRIGLSPPTNPDLAGIGAVLGFDAESRTLQITRVIPNSPAAEAGLTGGLIVEKIDDVPLTIKNPTFCAGLIRGKAGTKVRLELVDARRHETNTVELIRRKIVASK